ncbi:probable E3 ubiquitin-protein ligase HERC1 [Nothobranchius furzeri]|uniref:probable E3 ubiquitin-protein ligase HERC1 n=1 Tax=Nothobranchius furzeri TaxID=105023 RepID=UPI003904BC23
MCNPAPLSQRSAAGWSARPPPPMAKSASLNSFSGGNPSRALPFCSVHFFSLRTSLVKMPGCVDPSLLRTIASGLEELQILSMKTTNGIGNQRKSSWNPSYAGNKFYLEPKMNSNRISNRRPEAVNTTKVFTEGAEVCRMASVYSRTCVSPDSIQTGEAPVVSETCEVYVWGSNSSHQLVEGTQEKILQPKLAASFTDAQTIEAGQYCTFVISSDGSVRACGKGSYGRLGLGDSNNQSTLKKLTFEPHRAIKKVLSSKGSDGHTLAFTTEGEVFSWGDGDYGKLGHGNSSTQKYPKLIQGPLQGKVVVCVSAGYRHSAAVSEDGELYTWGEGDFGRLGDGDSNSRNIPTLVKDISNVGEVSCGSSHTIALSKDGRTVWSFGGGDNGKLGHGDTNRVYKPKVVEALQGMFIRKVCAGSQSSLALTSTGQVFAWGCGACLGCGSSEATALRPKLIEELATTRVVDISIGDSHCLALSHDNEVYAWGNNSMGQCGQGNSTGPITKPKKVVGLDGVAIQQISAGTSHSLAWTALPRDRQVVAWHRPYCVDLEESTFSHLRSFLERYCDGINSDVPPLPFPSSREHHNFLKLCLRLLSNHLALALAGGVATSILGRQARPLRNLLFRLMDASVPDEIQEAVIETLSVGATMLLPPLRERMELLHSLLPQGPDRWESLSKGQRMQLDIILTSLQDHTHVASLLGYSSPTDGPEVPSSVLTFTAYPDPAYGATAGPPDTHLAEILMKTLLRNLGFYTPYDSLPTSQTCFFQLRLPPYSTQAVMAERLRYAINNCRSIDMDNYMLSRNVDNAEGSDTDY